ncbi:MAG TPA: FAD-linked oxidase C-terminal domain-containing protein [Gemmatimonadales bacterium]|nr:FAD-linked oxidase C-terminal domain-containing protein [Gemmatimonadales bacterium]
MRSSEPTTHTSQALDAIASIVGPRWVRRAPAELETYASDGLPTRASRAAAVVLPGTAAELVRVVRVLAHYGIPFVPRGAGTGLSGGAVADDNQVLVVCTRLNRILSIDAPNRRATVEPGVVNVKLSEAARPYGLHYAPDPSSQSACTIGGNVAENAGGPHCLKYGTTTTHVLELEVVLPDGQVITLGSPGGEPWGPDLVGLFVGSEGMFGIATRITVRLMPLPRAVRTLLADFASIRAAGEAVSAIIAAGFEPAALEMMDRNCIRVVEASIYAAGYPQHAAAVLIVELDGPDEGAVAAESRDIEALLRTRGAGSVRVAGDEAERARLWQGRKKAFGALGRLNADLLVQDAVVPRSALPDVLERIGAIAGEHGLEVSNVFHAGDGNLHPNLTFDRRKPGDLARVEHASEAIMRACIAAGGTITGEHGVGSDKLRYMSLIFSPDTLGAMRAVRRAFDPQERANPGKVIPIHQCSEWRGQSRSRRGAAA